MIDEDLVRVAIEVALKQADFADLRYENSTSSTVEFVDGRTTQSRSGRLEGVGIRAKAKGGWGFATTSSLKRIDVLDASRKAAKLARLAAQRAEEPFEVNGKAHKDAVKPRYKVSFSDIGIEEKTRYVLSIDKQAHLDDRIVSTRTTYSESVDEWFIANSLGTSVRLTNLYPRISCHVYARDGGVIQRVYKSIGLTGGYEVFQSKKALKLGEETARLALKVAGAPVMKGGKFDVILDPDMTGVFAHEAFGHACEADGVLGKASILEGRLGQKLGSDVVTLVDDPTLEDQRGSFPYDQEGTKTKRRELVRNGILNDYLHSLETSSRMRMEPNGAARAMDFLRPPICRMSNTFIAPGDMNEEELLEGIMEGVKFYGFQYGYVDPGSGKFMFKALYGRLIRNGELGEYVRDVSLSGVSLEALKKVDGVAKNFDIAPGTCGKEGQGIPDGSGGPDIRVRQVVVGGTI